MRTVIRFFLYTFPQPSDGGPWRDPQFSEFYTVPLKVILSIYEILLISLEVGISIDSDSAVQELTNGNLNYTKKFILLLFGE